MKKFIGKIQAWWNGRKDGKANIPTDVKLTPPYIKSLINTGNACIKSVAEKWSNLDMKLKKDWMNAEFEYNKAQTYLQTAHQRENEMESKFEEHNDGIKPEKNTGRGYFWYSIIVLLITIPEFMLNKFFFKTHGEAEIYNWALALGIGIMFGTLAHTLGINLRKIKLSKKYIVISSVITGIAITGIVAMSILRSNYFNDNSPGTIFAYGAINLLLFAGLTFLSFTKHKLVEKEYKNALRGKIKAEKNLHKWQDKLNDAKSRRQKGFDFHKHRAIMQEDFIHWLCNIYWTKNFRTRKDGCFEELSKLPSLSIPNELLDLEWDKNEIENNLIIKPNQNENKNDTKKIVGFSVNSN